MGLPRGREPEWNFDGELHLHPMGVQFGTHYMSPLVATANGVVVEIHDDEQIYVNASILQFAACLTLRKRPFRIGSDIANPTDLRRAFEAEDPTAVQYECLWGRYLIECEEDSKEINDQSD